MPTDIAILVDTKYHKVDIKKNFKNVDDLELILTNHNPQNKFTIPLLLITRSYEVYTLKDYGLYLTSEYIELDGKTIKIDAATYHIDSYDRDRSPEIFYIDESTNNKLMN